jgi:hypothetical protein
MRGSRQGLYVAHCRWETLGCKCQQVNEQTVPVLRRQSWEARVVSST